MKALRRGDLIDIIEETFAPGEIIFEYDLQELMKQRGEDWFIDESTKSWKKCD